MVEGKDIMYYVYYDNTGNITSATNMQDASFGTNFVEVDLQTYEEFSNNIKQLFDYIVIKNAKISGKMHIVSRDLDKHEKLMQPTGVITKQDISKNLVIITQDITNGKWIVTHTMNDVNCSLFAQGGDHIKEYYVVDTVNRFILLDTFRVNLKVLAAQDTVIINDYNKEVCKHPISLLCSSHHVKHIHIVEE